MAIYEQLKALGALWRHLASIGIVLTSLYVGAKPFVQAWAGDAFIEMLKEQGLDPDAFAEIQKQSTANGAAIDELSADAERLKGQIGTVQQQIGRVSDQIEAQKDTGEKVEKLVQKLLDLQLRRSGGLSP